MTCKTQRAILVALLLTVIILMNACKPLKMATNLPAPITTAEKHKSTLSFDTTKKNVFIVADNKVTELFDMLAPFYLFNATGKANVYIITKYKAPIRITPDLFVLPQLTFGEADSLHLTADVIVIPAMSARDEHQDTVVTEWIKNHFTAVTKILAVCDGASTAAATGLYDGKPLTCHASDYANLTLHFSKPSWTQNVSVTKSGNLFSTAGVSNAVEGSLVVINELFGRETMLQVSADVHYPHPEVVMAHKSIAISGKSKFTIAKKLILRKNRRLGILLQDGVSELEMASVLDTYARTFPLSFKAYMAHDSSVTTKYGLTMVYAADKKNEQFDELHVLMPKHLSSEDALAFKNINLVKYIDLEHQYAIEACLQRIEELYGNKFKNVVKLLLDYN